MANPLTQAILSAQTVNDRLGRMFHYVGTDNPNGVVNKAYRNAYRGLQSALNETNPPRSIKEVFDNLREVLAAVLLRLLKDAAQYGGDEAERQLKYYGIKPPSPTKPKELSRETDAALAAILAQVDQQSLNAQALVLTNADREQILGSKKRNGALVASAVITLANHWAASMVWTGFEEVIGEVASQPRYSTLQKVTVAVVDDHTTECCLLVNGQIQPVGAPFHLVGDPHFASDMEKPPFHWHCRTSIALYLDGFDESLIRRMRAASQAILNNRTKNTSADF